MNRIQRVAIGVLFLVNMLLAAMAWLNRDIINSGVFLPIIFLVEGIVVAFVAISSKTDGSDLLKAGGQDALEEERQAAFREVDSLRAALSEADRERQRLTSQQGLAQAEVEQSKVELTRTKAALRTHDETLTTTRRQLDDANSALQNAEINLQARTAELEQVRQWRSRAEAELSALQHQTQEDTAGRTRLEQERNAAVERHRSVEKRQAVLEQELMNRSSLLQAALESVPEAIIVVAADLRPVLFNTTAVNLLGIDASDANLAQSVPKFGLYLADRTTQVSRDALPFVNALRGVATEPMDLFVRNSRRPAGVNVRAVARAVGESNNRTAIFVLQELRLGTAPVPPPPPMAPPHAPPPSQPQNGVSPPSLLEVPPVPPVSRPEGPPVKVPEVTLVQVGSLRVLLVEDSAVNQKLGVRVIEQSGHKATVAGSGLDALAAMEREEFDLVLMDLTMPGMGGIETTALIREQEGDSKKRVPIVAVTASSKEGSRERCLQWGMDGYIVKPLQPSKLEEVITALFKAPERNRT